MGSLQNFEKTGCRSIVILSTTTHQRRTQGGGLWRLFKIYGFQGTCSCVRPCSPSPDKNKGREVGIFSSNITAVSLQRLFP